LKHLLPAFQKVVEEEEWLIHYGMKQLHLYKNQDEYYQEGLIGLWEAYVRFNADRGVAFRTFAWWTVRGKLLSHLKKSKNREDREATLTNGLIEIVEDLQAEIPLEYESLLAYCEGLTPEQKKWVILHFLESKGPNQIAREENVSLETVKSWRRYALQKIRKNIVKMGR
jgi:RNA polymerase sigma factor (sigma-70 family)